MIIAPSSSFKNINPFFTRDGKKTWAVMQGDKFLATGIDCSGKRFRIESERWLYIKGINIYKGNRWLIRGGKRWLIESVVN